MAVAGLSQSTIPTFFTDTSTKLNGLINNQILICLNYLGERRNFITVDEVSIDSDIHTVQVCYDNGWITDFPAPADTIERKYKFRMLGTDYNNNANSFSFGHFFLRNFKDNMKVWKDGVLLDITDWLYLVVDGGGHPERDIYAKIIQIVGGVNPAEIYDFEYTEYINMGDNWGLKLYNHNTPNSLHAAMPTKSYHKENWLPGNDDAFLESAAVLYSSEFSWACTYRSFDVPTESVTINKIWGDRARLAEFPINYDLTQKDMELEVYTSNARKGKNAPNFSTRSKGGTGLVMVRSITNNEFRLDSFGGTQGKYAGKFYFRIRKISTGEYSEFFNLHVSVRSIPVCVTDESLSLNNCVGHMFTSKLSS